MIHFKDQDEKSLWLDLVKKHMTQEIAAIHTYGMADDAVLQFRERCTPAPEITSVLSQGLQDYTAGPQKLFSTVKEENGVLTLLNAGDVPYLCKMSKSAGYNPNLKINAIKAVRIHTHCGLKQAKDFSEGTLSILTNSLTAGFLQGSLKGYGYECEVAYALKQDLKDASLTFAVNKIEEGEMILLNPNDSPVSFVIKGDTTKGKLPISESHINPKIQAIKTLRNLLNCGLKEAKDLIEGTMTLTTNKPTMQQVETAIKDWGYTLSVYEEVEAAD